MFLEIWKNSQESTCKFIKKETLAQVFSCEFFEISKNTFLQNTSGRLLLISPILRILTKKDIIFEFCNYIPISSHYFIFTCCLQLKKCKKKIFNLTPKLESANQLIFFFFFDISSMKYKGEGLSEYKGLINPLRCK